MPCNVAVVDPGSTASSASSGAASATTAGARAVVDDGTFKVDAAVHLWSDGKDPYTWVTDPPDSLQKKATAGCWRAEAQEANVNCALVVQPANHKFDHSYVASALKRYPSHLRGMLLADGSLPPLDAISQLEELWRQGFVAARFNPSLFPAGLDGPTAKALFKRCGEISMPVGVMTFGGLLPHVAALRALVAHAPSTTLLIDHMGFFRQPATGGLMGAADASNDEVAWEALLELSSLPSVHVKVSALFRTSSEKPPHKDLAPRLGALLRAYGPTRLLWGSDWPFVLTGGNTQTDAACDYKDASEAIAAWGDVAGLEEPGAYEAIMGGNAQRLFGFWNGA